MWIPQFPRETALPHFSRFSTLCGVVTLHFPLVRRTRENMFDAVHHRLIERPTGISGISPASWYAVCGRKSDPNRNQHCTEECPNLCHVKCLAGTPEYN